jgi:ferredoxin
MKITKDVSRCVSMGVCCSLVPEVFEIRDDGMMHITDGRDDPKLLERITQAVKNCPQEALSITKDN